MPQKPIISRPPVLAVPNGFLSCGLARTSDACILGLYQRSLAFLEYPEMWEGLFRLACLVKNAPGEEPVCHQIRQALLAESPTGSLLGTRDQQICKARAALALYEYEGDRTVLQRLADWLRFLEAEMDGNAGQDSFLCLPGDLMEFLVRYYLITGMRSVLRICTRLRAIAFDWTTALQTFQQPIPQGAMDESALESVLKKKPEELGYDEKQLLIHHAESLADGMRYTLYAGLFSGNRMDLSAGRSLWNILSKHNRAICGGTTSDPFLCGAGGNAPVHTAALSAWAEAFADSMLLPGTEWAAEELIRILFNGLSYCLSQEELPELQWVNSIRGHTPAEGSRRVHLYARISRAVSSAFSHAVTITSEGVRINYVLPGKYVLSVQDQPVILSMEDQRFIFHCSSPFHAPADLLIPSVDSMSLRIFSGSEEDRVLSGLASGRYHRIGDRWQDQSGVLISRENRMIPEGTHHQGICFFHEYRLLCLPVHEGRFNVVYCGDPEAGSDFPSILTGEAEHWNEHDGLPSDIPVLPLVSGERKAARLIPYDHAGSRITMFPRGRSRCSK